MVESAYIYLLQEREFLKSGEPVFKIGKTRQQDGKRFAQYPKGSIVILHVMCPQMDKIEKKLIREFKLKYKHRGDIGAEYFEGCHMQMRCDIFATACAASNFVGGKKVSKQNCVSEQKTKPESIPNFIKWVVAFCNCGYDNDRIPLNRSKFRATLIRFHNFYKRLCALLGEDSCNIGIFGKLLTNFNTAVQPKLMKIDGETKYGIAIDQIETIGTANLYLKMYHSKNDIKNMRAEIQKKVLELKTAPKSDEFNVPEDEPEPEPETEEESDEESDEESED